MLELTFYRNQKKFVQPEYEERLFDHLGFEVADMNNDYCCFAEGKYNDY